MYMRDLLKRTTTVALAGVLAAGMLAGCGEKKVDGTKTVATVNGTEIPMGVLSLYAREQQAQTTALYQQFMGTSTIWDTVSDEDTGETYGESAARSALEQIELMYILKEKAADYGVEITDEEQEAIAEAAASFMEANDEETIEELSVTEDQVKTLLELETIQTKIEASIKEEAGIEVTEEEARQSSFTYVSITISGDDLTDDDIAARKEDAQTILDQVKEDPSADMDEIASGVDETYSALTGNFTAEETDDEDLKTTSYPDEVIEALRTLSDGEVYDELVETDTALYILRLDQATDDDATQSKITSVTNTKESNYYSETTEGWLDDADIVENEDVLKTLKITDSHTFSIKSTETEETTDETTETEDTTEAEDSTDTEDTAETEETTDTEDTAEAEDTTGTEEAADGAEETTEAEETADSETEDSAEAEATEAPTATPEETEE